MKRFLVPAIALGIASLNAYAEEAPIVNPDLQIAKVEKLSCRAANGVILESVQDSPYVESSWYGYRATFQLQDKPVVNAQNYVRITLGKKDAPTVELYDVFLWGRAEAGRVNALEGVIGQTLYGAVLPPFVESPETLPVAFRPIAAIRCELAGS